jgi:hypothetical protein
MGRFYNGTVGWSHERSVTPYQENDMKKLLALALVFGLTAAVVGCGSGSTAATKVQTGTSGSTAK